MLPEFISVHIPKTAGGTFRDILRETYKENLLTDDLNGRYGDLDFIYPPVKEHHLAIHGHFSVNKYTYKPWPIITFLREPLARLLSNYNYALKYPHAMKARGLTREDGIIPFAEQMPNLMTFFTAGNLDLFKFVGIQERFDLSLKIIEELIGVKFNPIYTNKNINNKKVKNRLTKKETDYITSINKEDFELYAEALARFNKTKRDLNVNT